MELNEFKLERILNEDSRLKSINLCLQRGDQKAVALLEKLPFDAASVLSELHAVDRELIDSNDIYHRFLYKNAGFECKLVYPATAAHIAKYSEQQRKMVTETPQMHQSVTRPFYGELRRAGQVAWIQNILDDKSELERRLFDSKCPESGFIILPDYKWVDESNVNALYLLAIVRRNDLWSVRDLTANELPLLLSIRQEIKNIFDASLATARYKFPDGSPVLYEHLRIFFHYPPTYPHLHIHIVLAGSSAMSAGAAVGQAILLDDVIENLQLDSEYYRSRRNLLMQFGVELELYKRLTQ